MLLTRIDQVHEADCRRADCIVHMTLIATHITRTEVINCQRAGQNTGTGIPTFGKILEAIVPSSLKIGDMVHMDDSGGIYFFLFLMGTE